MLDSLLILKSLLEANRIIVNARIEVASGSSVLWNKLNHSKEYLDSQIASTLSE